MEEERGKMWLETYLKGKQKSLENPSQPITWESLAWLNLGMSKTADILWTFFDPIWKGSLLCLCTSLCIVMLEMCTNGPYNISSVCLGRREIHWGNTIRLSIYFSVLFFYILTKPTFSFQPGLLITHKPFPQHLSHFLPQYTFQLFICWKTCISSIL